MSDLTHATERTTFLKLARALALPTLEPGWVWLTGAGPGDPGLITMHGLSAIATADVILYDALASDSLLRLARPDAELVFAGKRAGKRSCKQADISRTLIATATAGKRVLRLKGGDPFVFGRGAEEALALAAAGIPFRIVPGVTAGIGGLAYAGIPLTHRDSGQAVTFLTGHGADGKLPDFDWHAIAQGSPTLVFYMAKTHAAEISDKLIAAGRPPNEPAAVVGNATHGDQSVFVTTLAGLGEAAEKSTAPALLVIGKNVSYRDDMNWFSSITGDEAAATPPHKLRRTG